MTPMNSYFLKGPNGALFLCDYGSESSACVVHFPAFAEEMNKSRHLVHQQAEVLASAGYRVIILDPFGTGDSEGDFSDATPERWIADFDFLLSVLADQGAEHFTAWGLRAGCLLANAVALSKPVFDRFLFWAPMLDGKAVLAQFLRLRIAASMMAGQRETVNDLKAAISGGSSVIEVAGYGLHPDLPAQLEELSLDVSTFSDVDTVCWMDISSREGAELSLPARKLIDQLAGKMTVVSRVIYGDAFWGTQELAFVPALIEQTAQLLGSASGKVVGAYSIDLHRSTTNICEPMIVSCHEHTLLTLIHDSTPDILSDLAVVIVVGGPQYRIGSHRQFLLLSRYLATHGITNIRFDYRGMGNSGGKLTGFESIDDDIRATIDALIERRPAIKRIVLWGLCDGATASVFYAPNDQRVVGLVLLNPWVRSEQGEAEAFLKHYYLSRFLSKSFWKKFLSGGVNFRQSISSLVTLLNTRFARSTEKVIPDHALSLPRLESGIALPERLWTHLQAFSGKTKCILSENDLTAAEFRLAVKASDVLSLWCEGDDVEMIEIAGADHTFSTREWRDQVAHVTAHWVKQLDLSVTK